jgi:hypothetical protein
LSSFWDHLGSSVMEPGWCRDLVQKHDFITFCIRHHVVSIQLLQPKLVAPIIDMIIICYLILLFVGDCMHTIIISIITCACTAICMWCNECIPTYAWIFFITWVII